MTTLKLRVGAAGPLTARDHDDNMLRLYGFPTLADMLADDDRGYGFYAPGATVITRAEGYRYQVAASVATDHHLTTTAGLKLYVLPGDDSSFNLGAFAPAGDDANGDGTDDHAVFDRAFKAAAGNVLHLSPKSFFLSTTLENSHRIKVIGHGARLRFPAGTTGIINAHLWSTGNTAIVAKSISPANLLTYQTGLVKYAGQVYHPNASIKGTVYSSAQLAAEQPGTGSRWVHLRAEDGRDTTVPTWNGTGSYSIINYNPLHTTNYLFRPGTYVLCQPSGVYYRVAQADADDHDEITMFDRKLYIVDPADCPSYTSGAWSIFEDFTLDGTSVAGAPADGFRMRGAARLRGLTIENFSRHGVNAQAAVPLESMTNPSNWGHINKWSAEKVTTRFNGDIGFHARGSDGNAGMAYELESYGNGRLGIYDNSFLGNTYLGCSTWGNGNGLAAGNAGGRSSVVSHGGNLYQAMYVAGQVNGVPDAQLALYASTTPGTNAAVWGLIGEGDPSDAFPAWQSGKDAGFYFHGGGMVSNNSGRSAWFGCSGGDDEGGGVFQGNHILNVGGYQPLFNQGSQMAGQDGGALKMPSLYLNSHPAHVWLRRPNEPNNIFAFTRIANNSAAVWRLNWQNGDLAFNFQNTATNTAFLITDEDTALTFGTSSPIPYMFVAQRGIVIGAGNNGRRHDTLAAAPTTGEWARGDVVYNRAPSAGGNMGWICTTAGTPGTWKAFGSIAS